MKKVIIFDLDGTLIDTLEDLKNSVNFALNSKNYPIRTKEHVRKSIGNGVSKLVERCLPIDHAKEEHQETLKIFTEHYQIHAFDNTKPYDGVFELLTKLKNDGYLLAVATNKIQDVAQNLIDLFYPHLFDLVVGDREGIKKKPEPDMVNFIKDYFQVSKENCLYIGDTEVDRLTAVNSKIDYLIETYGYRTKDEWEKLDSKQKTFPSTESLYQEIRENYYSVNKRD